VRKDRFIILLASLFIFIILDLLLAPYRFGSRVIDIAWLILFLSCINAISGTRKHIVISVLLFACSAIAKLAIYLTEDSYYLLIGRSSGFAFSAAFYAYAGFLITVYVLKDGKVTRDKIAASICVYLIIGATWAMLFGLVETLDPGAFRTGVDSIAKDTKSAVYFSYITLTTVGYGDITPASPTARSLAMIEGIIGQLFIAVMIARLVGLHISHSSKHAE